MCEKESIRDMSPLETEDDPTCEVIYGNALVDGEAVISGKKETEVSE